MQATLRPFSLPLDQPLVTASGRVERREGFLVRVEEDGVVGVGEATPLQGWTEPGEDCRSALESAREALTVRGREPALVAVAATPAARHGLALALADLDARRADRPLYRHLGADDHVESVPVNATIGSGDVRATEAAARDAVAAGFECLKVKVGVESVDADVRRIAAVREAVGSEVAIRVDANGAWNLDEARRAVDAFGDLDVEYVEQPLSAHDVTGHSELRDGPVEIAVDETIASESLGAVLDADAADVVVLKPMALGGLDRAIAAISTAEDHGVRVVVTTTVDAVVARTAAVHLVASLVDPAPAGLATAGFLREDLGPDPAEITGGQVRVPQSRGLGVRLEEATS